MTNKNFYTLVSINADVGSMTVLKGFLCVVISSNMALRVLIAMGYT